MRVPLTRRRDPKRHHFPYLLRQFRHQSLRRNDKERIFRSLLSMPERRESFQTVADLFRTAFVRASRCIADIGSPAAKLTKQREKPARIPLFDFWQQIGEGQSQMPEKQRVSIEEKASRGRRFSDNDQAGDFGPVEFRRQATAAVRQRPYLLLGFLVSRSCAPSADSSRRKRRPRPPPRPPRRWRSSAAYPSARAAGR